MVDVHLVISPSERDLLVRMLQTAVRDKRVEIHRTEFSHDFRDQLEAEEQLMQSVLGKLTQPAEAT